MLKAVRDGLQYINYMGLDNYMGLGTLEMTMPHTGI
jgi:hypothetical protein